jgi:hypothetical protein
MNYFQAYLPSLDEAIVAAWDSQIAEAAEAPWLAQVLTTKGAELFPRFASRYAELRALPRGARRALQRQLARSGELAIPAEWQRKLDNRKYGYTCRGWGSTSKLIARLYETRQQLDSSDVTDSNTLEAQRPLSNAPPLGPRRSLSPADWLKVILRRYRARRSKH